MFVGVVVENFHKCRQDQEKEERERRTAKRRYKMEQKKMSERKLESGTRVWRNALLSFLLLFWEMDSILTIDLKSAHPWLPT